MGSNDTDGTSLVSDDMTIAGMAGSEWDSAGASEQQTTEPERLVPDLDLSRHTEGSWPSSKNVSQ